MSNYQKVLLTSIANCIKLANGDEKYREGTMLELKGLISHFVREELKRKNV